MDLYKSIYTKHLGKHFLKHSLDVLFNLRCVESGLKPSYLFDVGCVDADVLLRFLIELKEQELLIGLMSVLVIDQDLFIYNDTTFQDHIKSTITKLSTKTISVVDVSHTLSKPCLCNPEDLVSALQGLLDTLVMCSASHDKNALKLSEAVLKDSVNRTSLFGLCLGYPVVYWYNTTSNPDCRNCLDMNPLSVTSVSAEVKLFGHHSDDSFRGKAFSFSIPQSLCSELDVHIKDWLSDIKQLSTVKFDISTDVRVLPIVTM